MTDRNVHNKNVYSGKFDNRGSSNAMNSGTIHIGTTPHAAQLINLVSELRDRIAEQAAHHPNGPELRESAEMLEEQVTGETPKPGRVKALLASIASMAGNVTAITAAVNAVRAALGG